MYWDLQLLNTRKLNNICVMDKLITLEAQSTSPNTVTKAYSKSDSESLAPCTINADCLQVCSLSVADFLLHGCRSSVQKYLQLFYLPHTQMGGPRRKEEAHRNVRRLKKAARQCWARSAASVQLKSFSALRVWKNTKIHIIFICF